MTNEIEEKIGYHFKNQEHLFTALTHKSYHEGAKEKRSHNERLEFLGDSVIGLAITDHLFRKMRGRNEGELAKMKAMLVSANSLFQIASRLDLGSHLFLGKGEEKNRGRENKNILAAAFEALIGAVYIDSGFRTASQVTLRQFADFLSTLAKEGSRINDYKSELQEMIQRHRTVLPTYRVLSESGKPPHTVFRVAVFLDDVEIGQGQGRNRREAEQDAAMNALQQVGDFNLFEKLSHVFFRKSDPRESGDRESGSREKDGC